MPKSPLLTNWCIGTRLFDPYVLPETLDKKFLGEVTGHTRLKDGSMTTSVVIAFDPKRKVFLTKNTFYRLGNMDHGFKQWLRKRGIKITDYGFNQSDIPRRNLWKSVTRVHTEKP